MPGFDKGYIKNKLRDNAVIIFRLRTSRMKMKQAAVLEVFLLLSGLGAEFIPNGPLGDIKGVFSYFVPKEALTDALSRLPRLGYAKSAYTADFACEPPENDTPLKSINALYWKGNPFTLHRFFDADDALYEASSPHNRMFRIIADDGSIRDIRGYRGDGGETSRRALPVEDARFLLNLTGAEPSGRLLDPFAGAGGIIYEAAAAGTELYAADIDPILRPGLEYFGAECRINEVSSLDWPDAFFDYIATEAPFAPSSTDAVCRGMRNLSRMLKDGGKAAMMCAVHQAEAITAAAKDAGFDVFFSAPLDRKGTPVHLLGFTKGEDRTLRDFVSSVSKIY